MSSYPLPPNHGGQGFLNKSGATIQAGYGVEFDPDNDWCIRAATSIGNVIGVAIRDIPSGEHGYVMSRGSFVAEFSEVMTRGDRITRCAAGVFGIDADSDVSVGVVLESGDSQGAYYVFFDGRGAKGDKGDTGATGATGPQGPAGADGSDASVSGASGSFSATSGKSSVNVTVSNGLITQIK